MDSTDDSKLPNTRNKRKVTTVTRQEFVDGDGQDADELKALVPSLFDSDEIEEREITRIRVNRVDPNEGMLDYIEDMTSTEAVIKERWGGSTYRLDGLNRNGKIVKVKTIKVAGDPIFVSQAAEIQWRRAKGMPAMGTASAAPGQPAMSFQELMALMNAQTEKSEKEREAREERQRREEREHQMAIRKLETDAEDRRRKDDEERERRRISDRDEQDRRRAKEEEERDSRRRKDEQERDDRRRKEQLEAEQRAQAHTAQMLQMVQQSSTQALSFVKASSAQQGTAPDPMAQLVSTLKVIAAVKETMGVGDSEPDDLMSTLVKQLPAMLNGAGNLVGGIVREIKQGGTNPQQLTAPQAPALPIPEGSPLNAKVGALVEKLIARGQDPEKFLDTAVDTLHKMVDGAPAVAVNPQTGVRPVATVNAQPVNSVAPQAEATGRPAAVVRIPQKAKAQPPGEASP